MDAIGLCHLHLLIFRFQTQCFGVGEVWSGVSSERVLPVDVQSTQHSLGILGKQSDWISKPSSYVAGKAVHFASGIAIGLSGG